MAKFKNYIRASIIALAVFVSYQGVSYILEGETGKVRRFIFQGRKAVERENMLLCAEMISFDYNDKYGNDRSSLIYAIKEGFAYYAKIFINIEEIDIKLSETNKEAKVTITALVIGQPKDRMAEKIMEGDKGQFRVILFKEDDKWKLTQVEFLERVTIMGHEIT